MARDNDYFENMLASDPIGLAHEMLDQIGECESRRHHNEMAYLLAVVRQKLVMLREMALGGAADSEGETAPASVQSALAGMIADIDAWLPGDFEYEAMQVCDDCLRLCHRNRVEAERVCECGQAWIGDVK